LADGLGRGIATRARPRLGTAGRHQRVGAIGLVGRSTIGFGRIIASAGSARPTVTADVLTSLSLRPPSRFWAGWAADEPEAEPPRPSWTTRAASPPPPARRRFEPKPPAQPKASPTTAAIRKVDSLRSLLERRGMIEAGDDRPVAAAPSDAGPPATDPAATPTHEPPAAAIGDRTATSAGPTTAPGELARRSRPESGAPGGNEGLAVDFPDAPAPTRQSRRSAPADIDRFRDALTTRGLVPGNDDRSAATRPVRGRPARETRSDPDRRGSGSERIDPPPSPSARRTPSPRPDHGAMGDGPQPRDPAAAAPMADPRDLPTSISDDVGHTDVGHLPHVDPTPDVGRTPAALPLSLLPEQPSPRPWTVADAAGTGPVGPPVAVIEPGPVTVVPPTEAIARSSAPQHSTPSNVATDDAGSTTLRRTERQDRRAATTDLRDVGQRIGLPHTRSLANRPETELTADTQGGVVDIAAYLAGRSASTPSPESPVAVAVARTVATPGPRPTPARVADAADTPEAAGRPAAVTQRSSRLLARPGTVFRDLARDESGAQPVTAASGLVGPTVDTAPSALARALAPLRSRRRPYPAPEPATTPDPDRGTGRATIRRSSERAAPSGEPERPGDLDDSNATTVPEPSTPNLTTLRPPSVAPDLHGSELADRFLAELGREPTARARPLPDTFQPLASAITGSARPARVSTDATTRRALQSVGKRAATVDDVIHLARAPQHDARAAEVIAHELTHVAHPSPAPRFFDDDHRGPEERMAEQVAKVIARSPVMPAAPVPSTTAAAAATATASGGAPAAGNGGNVIRRSAAPPLSSGPGAVSAADLAAALDGGTSSTTSSLSAPPIRRSASRSAATSIRRDAVESVQRADDEGASSDGQPSERDERAWFEGLVNQSIEHILRRLEERVIIDLERRGGRHWRNL
jgi:hypothetical protein